MKRRPCSLRGYKGVLIIEDLNIIIYSSRRPGREKSSFPEDWHTETPGRDNTPPLQMINRGSKKGNH